MEREIILSKDTKTLINAVADLNRASDLAYSYVRREYSLKDSLDDETGSDIVKATDNLRNLIFGYLKDRVLTGTSSTTEGAIVL